MAISALSLTAQQPGENPMLRSREIAYESMEKSGYNVSEKEILINGSLGEMIGFLYTPDGVENPALIICSHGFGGSYLNTQPAAKFFATQGYAAYSYSFCGGGPDNGSAGTMEQMSVLTEAKDLNAVINYFRGLGYKKIFLFGQSQGGFVSTYVASEHPDEIAGLVLEYPAYVLQDDAKARRLPDGTFPTTSHVMNWTIGRIYNVDATSFDIYDKMKLYTNPVLIVHGDNDRIVPPKYALRAVDAFPDAELLLLPREGHGFSADGIAKSAPYEITFLNQINRK